MRVEWGGRSDHALGRERGDAKRRRGEEGYDGLGLMRKRREKKEAREGASKRSFIENSDEGEGEIEDE